MSSKGHLQHLDKQFHYHYPYLDFLCHHLLHFLSQSHLQLVSHYPPSIQLPHLMYC
ncbi:hypothetical protein OIU77_027713 [Salix suchowensis]|uniref:Uncharacterized protein n=1 Tax=Salix suchowensis TaxID=1278906 RepID=A0ABQ9BTU6_9ROSI|nr:hypothetical protein OIU77_027713 [Salix suchowensis]